MVVVFIMQLTGQIHLGASSKFLAVKNGREATKAAGLALVLMALSSVIWFIPPMVARFIYASGVESLSINDPATAAYAVAARQLLPHGLMGVMIAAMFSATMSSMDMGMNHLIGIIVRNLLPSARARLRLAPLSEFVQVRWCRGVTAVLGGLIITFSLIFAQQGRCVLFDAYLFFASLVNFPVFLPLLAGIFFRHLPRWGFIAMMGTALIPGITSLVQEKLGATPWTIQERGAWVFGFFLIALFVRLLFSRRSPPEHRAREAKFFATLHRPVNFAEEVGANRDAEQASLIGRAVCITGGLFLLFLVVPNSGAHRAVILALALFIIAIGAILLRVAHQAGKGETASRHESP
ncbi:MAG: hypothetical protein J6386_11275 [Candidatus Synoicihabitans palmerolidicus]|nr:hypothetical protein [Candidatus Synoicihabitans palmerolidicus]